MKIYLILLAISFIGYVIITVHAKKFVHENYKRIKPQSFSDKFAGYIRMFISILLIFPFIITTLCFVFNYDNYVNGLKIAFENDKEHWEKRVDI